MVVLFILLQIMSLYNPSHIKYLNRYFKHFMFMGFFYRKNQLTHCFKLPVDILVNISLQILRHIQIQICSWWQITFFTISEENDCEKSALYFHGGRKQIFFFNHLFLPLWFRKKLWAKTPVTFFYAKNLIYIVILNLFIRV